jgi:glutathione S-transferase
VVEIHDVHHPIGSGLYYEDQKPEAKRRSADFLENRAPKFLGYFERVAKANKPGKGRHLVGARLTTADLSLFQIVSGLRYAFPKAMAKLEKKAPRVVGVHDAVAALPRIRAYLESERRIPFNTMGIFRYYPELDSQ